MIVIPFDRRLDWRRPPLITIALVLINVLVFFLFQGQDDRRLDAAVDYYHDTGLGALELPHYRDYLMATDPDALDERFETDSEDGDGLLLWRMLRDEAFMQRLRADQVIEPADAEYAQWRPLRSEFDRQLERVSSFRWGFVSAKPRWYAALTHMFLHADLGHLLGNMFFLFAVGFLVEGAIGRMVYLGSYVLSGFGALGLYALVEPVSSVPMVGASGAIAGLMGMYAVLFGRRRISFFYFVLVYFDYVKAPAVLLLGLWLGFELIQYFWLAPGSSVAYMAHVGGLLSGALIALLLKKLTQVVDESYLAENEENQQRADLYARMADKMARLDFAEAAVLIEQLLQEQPDDIDLLNRLLTCTRFQPASDAYHRAANRVFSLTAMDSLTDQLVLDTYRSYAQTARPKPRFSAAVVRSLLPRFIRMQAFKDAERLLALMLGHPKLFPDAATALATLAHGLAKQQNQRAQHYYRMLIERFPASPEAALAKRMLQ